MKLSIVVPTLDEAQRLTATLASLAPLRAAGHEVIVVDGGSRDDSVAAATPHADRVLAAPRGRAVLVSSHLLSEVEQSVDDVVVIAKGVMRANGPIERVLGGGGEPVTRARSGEAERLAGLLRDRDFAVDAPGADLLLVHGTSPEAVGEVAAEHRVVLRELVAQTRSLEEAFFELTEQST